MVYDMDFKKMFMHREIRSINDLESVITDVLTNIPKEFIIDYDNETADKLGEISDSLKEYLFLYKQAIKALEERRYENATGILELLLERNPDTLEIRELLAKLYTITDYPNKAIREWKELLRREPGNSKYAFELANSYYRREWYKQAISQFRQLIEKEPDNVEAWERLVDCYYENMEDDYALKTCIEAIEILKNERIESIRLYADAFILSKGEDYPRDIEYLIAIINLIKTGDEADHEIYEDIIDELLHNIEINSYYEMLPYIREMVDILPIIDSDIVKTLEHAETTRDMDSLEDYPERLHDLFVILLENRKNKDADVDIMAMECSILNDIDGYRPFLLKLKTECPKLYALHSYFFECALSDDNPKAMLQSRISAMARKELRPVLLRADNSEDKSGEPHGTVRREGKKIGRNDPCPCKSGKKFKKCCDR